MKEQEFIVEIFEAKSQEQDSKESSVRSVPGNRSKLQYHAITSDIDEHATRLVST